MPRPAVHLPSVSQQLVIAEERYRRLYDDLLASGGRRFVVACERRGRLAEVGVVFRLDDVREISGPSHGHMKYVGEHSVCERARIIRIENPEAWRDQSTYLRAEVEVLDGPSAPEDAQLQEEALAPLRSQLAQVLQLQARLREEPRLPDALLRSQSFWEIAGSLGSLLAYRLDLRVREMHAEVRRLIQAWAKENPEDFEAMKRDPGVVPEAIRAKGAEARETYAEGSERLQGAFQRMLQGENIRACCSELSELLQEEHRRLLAVRSLRGIFSEELGGGLPEP